MHFSCNTDGGWEYHNLIIRKIQLFCKRCVIAWLLLVSILLRVQVCHREELATCWILKEKCTFFKTNQTLNIVLELLDQLSVGFDLHDIQRKINDIEDFSLLGLCDHLLGEVVNVEVQEVGQDLHQIVIIFIPSRDILAACNSPSQWLLAGGARVCLFTGAIRAHLAPVVPLSWAIILSSYA